MDGWMWVWVWKLCAVSCDRVLTNWNNWNEVNEKPFGGRFQVAEIMMDKIKPE